MKLSRKNISIVINGVLSAYCKAPKCHWVVFSPMESQSDNHIALCLGWNWLEKPRSFCTQRLTSIWRFLFSASYFLSWFLSLHCYQWQSSLRANWVQWWGLTVRITWYNPALCFPPVEHHTASRGSSVVTACVFSNAPQWPIIPLWLNTLGEI